MINIFLIHWQHLKMMLLLFPNEKYVYYILLISLLLFIYFLSQSLILFCIQLNLQRLLSFLVSSLILALLVMLIVPHMNMPANDSIQVAVILMEVIIGFGLCMILFHGVKKLRKKKW